MSQRSVGIIYKHYYEPAKEEALKLEQWLRQRGITVFSEEMGARAAMNACFEEPSFVPREVQFVIVLVLVQWLLRTLTDLPIGALLAAASMLAFSGRGE